MDGLAAASPKSVPHALHCCVAEGAELVTECLTVSEDARRPHSLLISKS